MMRPQQEGWQGPGAGGEPPATDTAASHAPLGGSQQLPRADREQAALPTAPLPLPSAAHPAAAVVRQACDLLALPSRVACTALTFLHRLRTDELPAERLASACIFLAAKVEEASVRTNDMLNAVVACNLIAAAAATADGAGSDSAAAVADFPCLVGEAYQHRKRQLILDEQLLLRRLRFDISVDQPHRHLYVLAHCWGASGQAVHVAVCLLNDCVCHCPTYGGALQPATAAAAALQVAAQLCRHEVQPAGWWRATGISDGEMAVACQALLHLVTHGSSGGKGDSGG